MSIEIVLIRKEPLDLQWLKNVLPKHLSFGEIETPSKYFVVSYTSPEDERQRNSYVHIDPYEKVDIYYEKHELDEIRKTIADPIFILFQSNNHDLLNEMLALFAKDPDAILDKDYCEEDAIEPLANYLARLE